MKNNNIYFPRNLLQTLIFIGLYILIITIVYLLFKTTGLFRSLQLAVYSILVISLSSIIIILIFLLKNRRTGIKLEWFNFHLNGNVIKSIPILLSLIFIYQFGILAPVLFKLSNSLNEPKLQNPFESKYHIVNVLFLAPILEEIICRGIILKGLLLTYSVRKAIVFSALLFGLLHADVAHLNFFRIIDPIFVGILLGWSYYKTNSLFLCIILHSITNVFGFMTMYFKYWFYHIDNLFSINNPEIIIWGVLGISIFLLFFLIRCLSKRMDFYNS